MVHFLIPVSYVHVSAKRLWTGCVNAASKPRQKWYEAAATKHTKPGQSPLAEPCTTHMAGFVPSYSASPHFQEAASKWAIGAMMNALRVPTDMLMHERLSLPHSIARHASHTLQGWVKRL